MEGCQFGSSQLSSVFLSLAQIFGPSKQPMYDCFVLGDRSIRVLIKWKEIIQKKEKTLETELQRLHPDPMYPAVAVPTATGCSGSGHPTDQTFTVSGSEFNKWIKTVAGADQDFSSPSFKRGCVPYALCCGFTSCSDPSNGRSEKQCWTTLFGPASSVTTYGSLLRAFLHLSLVPLGGRFGAFRLTALGEFCVSDRLLSSVLWPVIKCREIKWPRLFRPNDFMVLNVCLIDCLIGWFINVWLIERVANGFNWLVELTEWWLADLNDRVSLCLWSDDSRSLSRLS